MSDPSSHETAERSGNVDPLRPPVAGETPVDLTRSVAEMKRLLEQIEKANEQQKAEEAAGAVGTPGAVGALQVTARLLQYVHDSHARIVKTLENQDRSELFLQSTTALNQTFKRLNHSQDALVDKLLAERRRNPWYLVAGATLTAVVVVVAIFLLVNHQNGGLKEQVDRMAATRDELNGAVAESLRSFNQMGTQLGQTVDKVLAANRVLDNESRANHTELEKVKASLAAIEAAKETAEKDKVNREERLATLERDKKMLEAELDQLRSKMVDKDLAEAQMQKLLDERIAAGNSAKSPAPAKDAAVPPPDEKRSSEPPKVRDEASAETPPATALDPSAKSLPDPVPSSATESTPKDGDPAETPAPGLAAIDPTTRAFNEFLMAAGVVDHRLLRHGEVENGELTECVIELRDSSGRPIGCRSAAGVKLTVDPGKLTAKLLLRDGETVERGARTPFPDGKLTLDIAAVAPQSFTVTELMPFLVLEAPVPAEKPVVAKKKFDSREPLALLNAQLAASGRDHLRFSRLTGIDGSRLLDVEMNHYSGAGKLLKTVVARSCSIEVDAAARRVGLVFRDGHHVADGREVPFFQGHGGHGSQGAKAEGQGSEPGVWRLDLDDIDPEAWVALKDSLVAERFEN